MKKSQTATEYLIILAVVIIIALIVIGVLGGIPRIGSNIRLKADNFCADLNYDSAESYEFNEEKSTYHIVCVKTIEDKESFDVSEEDLI